MILQLTTAGRALIDQDPVGSPVTRVVFGSGFNYTVPGEPTGLSGSAVYTSNLQILPRIISTVSIRYAVQLAASVASFTFGELALYCGATLLGVAVNPTLITKTGPSSGNDGRPLKLSFFIDLLEGQRYALGDMNGDAGGKSFPRLPVPDLLTPPAKNGDNAFIIYGLTETDVPYFAFADPTGKWSFSSKPSVLFTGDVSSASTTGMQASSFAGSYAGPDTDLVLQFTSGRLRGYCRVVTYLTDEGAIQWNTPFTIAPSPNDSFIIVGPATAGGGGTSIDFQDEGYSLGYIGSLNEVSFEGEGVNAFRSGNKVIVTIPGGGGGGSATTYLAMLEGETTGFMNRGGFTDWNMVQYAPADFVSWSEVDQLFNFDQTGTYRVTVKSSFQDVGPLAMGHTMYGVMFDGNVVTEHSRNPTFDSTWVGTEKRTTWTDVFTLEITSANEERVFQLFVDNYTNAANEVSFQASLMIEKLTRGPFQTPV